MLKLASLFTDGAVLQRRKTIPVWGWTGSGHLVSAELAGQRAFTRASRNGAFMLRLPALEAGGPHELVVTDVDAGEAAVVRDVLVGEIWIASGQSNMEYPLHGHWNKDDDRFDKMPQEEDFLARLAKAGGDRLRFVQVTGPAMDIRQETIDDVWKKATDYESAKAFSAIGLWFGLELMERLGVPVGILGSYWGGTIVEAWTSREALVRDEAYRATLPRIDASLSEEDEWARPPEEVALCNQKKLLAAISAVDPGVSPEALAWIRKPMTRDWQPFAVPGSWIARCVAGNGAVWIRRIVKLPDGWRGKKVVLHLGGIDKQDITFANGVEIGRTGSGTDCSTYDVPRVYAIPPELTAEGTLDLAVRGYSFIYDGSFNGSPDAYHLDCGDERIELAGEWMCRVEADYGLTDSAGNASASHNGNPNTPGILYDTRIHPLVPYALRGAIWYQGESNAVNVTLSLDYRRKLLAMIEDWRFRFGQGDFPFLQVQLAGFREPTGFEKNCSWAFLREAQERACGDGRAIGMATAIDLGEVEDIHPHDKKEVARRLATLALHDVYGETDAGGENLRLSSWEVEGTRLRITLNGKTTADAMLAAGASGFYIAGSDRNFHSAAAQVAGTEILLTSPEVPHPVAARYNWTTYPSEGFLRNAEGLPLLPFRTDNWNL